MPDASSVPTTRTVSARAATVLLVVLLATLLSAACASDGEDPTSSPKTEQKGPSTAPGTPVPSPVASEEEEEDAGPPKLVVVGRSVTVHASANIFGAGRAVGPGPAGGGGGSAPPGWKLSPGLREVVFTDISGKVLPTAIDSKSMGAAGRFEGTTDVESYRGISGIKHRRNTMFLVGVFLTDARPSGKAPPSLDVTRWPSSGTIETKIGQTFLIGDGKNLTFLVPEGATRLFVGFADSYAFVGPPGWYGNNSGELQVTLGRSG